MKKTLGLYIHIPFCEGKCNYCGFLSFVLPQNLCKAKDEVNLYFEYLIKEIEFKSKSLREEYVVDTIFIGGGTPSAVDGKFIKDVLENIRNCFQVEKNVEITIEVNPNSLIKEKILLYKDAGVNRFSMGVQSFNDFELKKLGRLHDKNMAVNKIKMCRSLGIENLSFDLIFDIPMQTVSSWEKTLDTAIVLEADHISAYSLQIEEKTKFYEEYRKGKISTSDDETLKKMYDITIDTLEKAGYMQYEISNFSKKNRESRHNIKYWQYDEYLGFGMGASSYIKGKRWENPTEFADYCVYSNMGENDFKYYLGKLENISKKDSMGIFVFTALRMKSGLDFDKFKKEFGTEFQMVYRDKIAFLKDEEKKGNCILDLEKKIFRLTQYGFLVSNDIMCEFV